MGAVFDDPTATVVAAAIGAFVALMVVIITKEQKVSEFRQAWIDGLRAEIAEAIAAASALSIALQEPDKYEGEQTLGPWSRFSVATHRVQLRLNLKEDLHHDLQDCVRRAHNLVRDAQMDPASYDPPKWLALNDEVVEVSQKLLKDEWERVKTGEPIFRIAKWSLVSTVIIAFAWALAVSVEGPERLPAKTGPYDSGDLSKPLDRTSSEGPPEVRSTQSNSANVG